MANRQEVIQTKNSRQRNPKSENTLLVQLLDNFLSFKHHKHHKNNELYTNIKQFLLFLVPQLMLIKIVHLYLLFDILIRYRVLNFFQIVTSSK